MDKTLNKLIDVIPLIKNIWPHDIIKPQYGMSLPINVDDYEDKINHTLCAHEYIWGSDCIGGFAYFGLHTDMLKIQEQSNIYLQKLKKSISEQFYVMWNIGNYSLILLYEDYQNHIDNPYPSVNNVMMTPFGAWTDDVYLLDVLKEKLYWKENWLVGDLPFDLNNEKHQQLLENFKNTIIKIDPITDQ